MSWDIVRKVVPVIATTLGGPLAGIAVDFVTSKLGLPKQSAEEFKQTLAGMGPEQMVKVKQIEAELQTRLAELGYENIQKVEELNVRTIEAINATMQVEAKAEHWPTYTWRPFIGFTFGFSFFIVSSLCCYLAYLAVIERVPDAMGMISSLVASMTGLFSIPGAILGVTAWYRGKMQADPTIPTINRG